GLRARHRRLLAPQRLDQPIGRNDLVDVQQQQREQRPLLDARERDNAVAVNDLKWTEDPELHRVTHSLPPLNQGRPFFPTPPRTTTPTPPQPSPQPDQEDRNATFISPSAPHHARSTRPPTPPTH